MSSGLHKRIDRFGNQKRNLCGKSSTFSVSYFNTHGKKSDKFCTFCKSEKAMKADLETWLNWTNTVFATSLTGVNQIVNQVLRVILCIKILRKVIFFKWLVCLKFRKLCELDNYHWTFNWRFSLPNSDLSKRLLNFPTKYASISFGKTKSSRNAERAKATYTFCPKLSAIRVKI